MLKTLSLRERFPSFKKAFLIAMLDFLSIAGAYLFGLWVRFDFSFNIIPSAFRKECLWFAALWSVISIVVFSIFNLYKSVWTFVSTDEFFRIVVAYFTLGLIGTTGIVTGLFNLPYSCYIIGFVLSFCLTVAIRFSYRFMRQVRIYLRKNNPDNDKKNVMIIGAGMAGRALITEFKNSEHIKDRVVCVIDDNPQKIGKILCGAPIVGDRNDIPDAVEKYEIDKIIYAIAAGDPETKKQILDICSKTGCQMQLIPPVYQLINGNVSVGKLRKVEVEDLLGREPIKVNMDEIFDFISGKTVLVTGGGGSIGSELCRQVARSHPKQLIIFDIYENNAYDIQKELEWEYPGLNLEVLIGSVRNSARLDYIMANYKPDIVFHAAAHKHVPLMEDSPNEAIKNNVFGTYKTASAAAKYGVKRFVLISTDKAVNPTNIMGASKRLCEMVVQMMNRQAETEFVAVRFGNVLGSNGSVIPLFKKQIEAGGPVTVTHPDIIRYFMTIPEAVSLVLQASYYAKGGEIFVLDMGEPVKIDTMARQLIRLSGYEPDVDIMVEYTGLRPGEKLYEELLMKEEGMQDTGNKLIHIGKPIEMDDELFKEQLDRLNKAAKDEKSDIKTLVEEIVPTYKRKK